MGNVLDAKQLNVESANTALINLSMVVVEH